MIAYEIQLRYYHTLLLVTGQVYLSYTLLTFSDRM